MPRILAFRRHTILLTSFAFELRVGLYAYNLAEVLVEIKEIHPASAMTAFVGELRCVHWLLLRISARPLCAEPAMSDQLCKYGIFGRAE
jgi:hypothetical protein